MDRPYGWSISLFCSLTPSHPADDCNDNPPSDEHERERECECRDDHEGKRGSLTREHAKQHAERYSPDPHGYTCLAELYESACGSTR